MKMKIEKVFSKVLLDDGKIIRKRVFIEEQGFKDEFDRYDDKAIHLVMYYNQQAVATGRLFTKDPEKKTYIIGRLAVIKEYRQLGLGELLVSSLEEKAKEKGAQKISISAQCRVEEFYKKMGYSSSGDIYFEEYCPHIHMEKIL
jgi:predicted GNAT family N-acyltransferase